ncbi:MAG: YjbH domain-containing protein [Alphaproteobacteria bacterium]|nr:YjbH domain-containing protein [Alphaproteobacteria bacterium]
MRLHNIVFACFCATSIVGGGRLAFAEDDGLVNSVEPNNYSEWQLHKIFPKPKHKPEAELINENVYPQLLPHFKPKVYLESQSRAIYPQAKPWKPIGSSEEQIATVYPRKKPLTLMQGYYAEGALEQVAEAKDVLKEDKKKRTFLSALMSLSWFGADDRSSDNAEEQTKQNEQNKLNKSIETQYYEYEKQERIDSFELKEGIHRPTLNDFGGAGLLQTPNARFTADGEVGVGTNFVSPYNRSFIHLQLFPWLETVFRYTYIDDIAGGTSGSSFRDRGVDIKLRLLEEGKYLPALAIGLRDIGGERISGGEYIVASKRYNKFDFSAGLGWGNMGTRADMSSPFGNLGNKFKDRNDGVFGDGSANFFHGEDVGIFGGLEYQTPVDGLRFKLEYDSNDYSEEYEQSLKSSSPINVGLLYEAYNWLDLSLGYERGNTIMFTANIHNNFNKRERAEKKCDASFPVVPASSLRNSFSRTEAREKYEKQQKYKMAEIGNIGLGYFYGDVVNKKADYQIKPASKNISSVSLAMKSLRDIGIIAKKIDYDKGTLHIHIDEKLSFDLNGDDILFPEFSELAEFSHTIAHRGWKGKEVRDVIFHLSKMLGDKSVGISEENSEQLKFDISDIDYSYTLTGSPVALIKPATPEWNSVVASVYSAKKSEQVSSVSARNLKSKNVDKNIKIIGQKVFLELAEQGLVGDELGIDGYNATLYFSNPTYINSSNAMARAVLILMSHIPDEVEELSLVMTSYGVAMNKVRILRKDVENLLLAKGSIEEVLINTIIEPAMYESRDEILYAGMHGRDQYAQDSFDGNINGENTNYVVNDAIYPLLTLSVDPNFRQDIGGDDDFYRWQLWLEGNALYRFNRNLFIDTSVGLNILNNFEEDSSSTSGSNLHRVRSDAPSYVRSSDFWINNLEAHYITELSEDVYVRGSAGIMEMMFTGVGGEILYRPTNKDWAIGLDANYVKQRDFNGGFGLQSYDTFTGHVSLYKKLGIYDLDAVLRAGKYLAKDNGVTLEISRTFENGVEVGAFVTVTDVSEDDDGEDGTDKGMFVHVPLDVFAPKSTKKNVSAVFRSLTRDRGQRLNLSRPLYELTDENSKEKIINGWHNLVD